MKYKSCKSCRYAKAVFANGYANGGFTFLGCYYSPYKGKWIAELKDCPKADMRGEKKDYRTLEEWEELTIEGLERAYYER